MIEYRIVPGLPEYRVGDDGSVWSRYTSRGNPGCHLSDVWKQLKPSNVNGYRVVNLCSNKKRHRWLVHRLVALAFLGPEPEGQEVCHDDGDPANNRLDNLRYDTRKGNMADQLKHGTRNRGRRQGHVKLTETDVLYIRKRYAEGGISQYQLAKRFDVHVMNINQIIHRKSWAWLEDSTKIPT